MADVERQLLYKAITVGEFPELVSAGIEEDHFADPECRDVYDFAMRFQRKYEGNTPPPEVLKKEFPGFSGKLSKAPLSYHVDQFIKKVKERTAIELVRDYHDAIEDPDQIDDIELRALDMARQLTEIIPATRASKFSEQALRQQEYERRKKTGNIHGIYMGVPTIDNETLGIQPHEFVVIVAYLGVGKSTMMQQMAYSAYLQGKKSLYISLEMEAEAILRKIDVMATGVKYHAMKALELGSGDMEAWKKIGEAAHQDRHERDIIVRDDIPNCTADNVMAEVWRHKPDIVFVDYLELMHSPKSVGQGWEGISYSGKSLKQSARIMKVPCVSAAQLNRDGGKGEVTLANVGHQSVGKHADLVVGLAQDEEAEARQEMDVILLKNRDGKKARARMRWQLERMDIGEKGVEERFPSRGGAGKAMLGPARRKQKQLEIARAEAGIDREYGEENPWTARKRKQEIAKKKKPVKLGQLKKAA